MGWSVAARYITRPAIANERLKRNDAGDVVLQLKSAWRDGTTHIVMSPLEFMQRLAALVPRPRLHLIRFHGVLAPHAGLRAAIVPGPAQNTSEPADEHAHGAPARLGWARLLKRVFEMDLEHCPHCGGALKVIAAIEEPAVIVKILTHLGLPARAPPRLPARPRCSMGSIDAPRAERASSRRARPPAMSCGACSTRSSRRLMNMLTRQGHLVEEQGMTCLADIGADSPLRSLQAASCTYRIAFGPRAGQKVLSLRTVPGRDEKTTQTLCADAHGFSLHAGVRCGAHQRKELERLCRCIARSAIANGRFPTTAMTG